MGNKINIILVVVSMLLIASVVYNIVQQKKLSDTMSALEAEKLNYGKNNAVKTANRDAIDDRKPYRDSLLYEINKAITEKQIAEEEQKLIRKKYQNLYDAIYSIDNNRDHMLMGDSLISVWENR